MALADTALHLSQVLDIAYPALSRFDIPRRSASHKAGGWTNHQILGHLVDSAANNHQKFVRLAASPRLSLDGYGQDDWVSMQRYEDRAWASLLDFWKSYNEHLVHVLQHLPPESAEHQIRIGDAGPFSLAFIAADYVEHLKHHLLQMAPDLTLDSKFENIY